MNNLKWAIAVGATVVAFSALPSQAATISTTTMNSTGGTISPSAYRIENLLVDGSSYYDVQFDYGSFHGLYGNPTPDSAYAGTFAKTMGDAIVAALQDGSIEQIIDTTFTSGPQTDFYIPESPTGLNSNQHLLAHCFTTADARSLPAPSSDFCNDSNREPSQSDSVLFARFSEASAPPTAVPTPALLPGLLGMGAAVLRRRK